MLRILGIDPGFDRTGFGVLDQVGSELKWVDHGCLTTEASAAFGVRLCQLREGLQAVIKKYKPEIAAVEKLFFSNNAKTAIQVGMARGVILLTLTEAHLPVVEMTPQQAKQGITGWGGANKKGVQEMVKRLLSLDEIPKPDDAADALAIAFVGASMYRAERN